MTDNKYALPLSKLTPEISRLEHLEEQATAEITRQKQRRRVIRQDLKAFREAAALIAKKGGSPTVEYAPAEGEDARPVDPPFSHRKMLERGTEVFIDNPGGRLHHRHGRVQHDTGEDTIVILLDGAEAGQPFPAENVKVVVDHWHPHIGDEVRVIAEGVWLGTHGRVVGQTEKGLFRVKLDGYADEEGTSLWNANDLSLVAHHPAAEVRQ